jgi:hypothetical protein
MCLVIPPFQTLRFYINSRNEKKSVHERQPVREVVFFLFMNFAIFHNNLEKKKERGL